MLTLVSATLCWLTLTLIRCGSRGSRYVQAKGGTRERIVANAAMGRWVGIKIPASAAERAATLHCSGASEAAKRASA